MDFCEAGNVVWTGDSIGDKEPGETAIEVVGMRMLRFYPGVTRKGNTRNERTRGNSESGHDWKGQHVKAGMVRSSILGTVIYPWCSSDPHADDVHFESDLNLPVFLVFMRY